MKCSCCKENKAAEGFNKGQHYCKSCQKIKVYEWRKNNPNKHKQQLKKDFKKHYNKNKKKHNRYINEYQKQRMQKDPVYKLQIRMRRLIHYSLNKKGYKKSSKVHILLGCDFTTLQKHLIQTAIKNYGTYDSNKLYHIDHIVPCSSAKTEEELVKLQHYTNLQYLTPQDNLRKSDKTS